MPNLFQSICITMLLACGTLLVAAEASQNTAGSKTMPDALTPDRTASEAAQRAEELKRYDQDGDGILSYDERRIAAQDKPKMLKKYDKNRDGKLSEAEFNRFEAHLKMLLRHFDKNQDGILDSEERKTANDAYHAKHKKKKAPASDAPGEKTDE